MNLMTKEVTKLKMTLQTVTGQIYDSENIYEFDPLQDSQNDISKDFDLIN